MGNLNLKRKREEASVVRLAKVEKVREKMAEDPTVMQYGLNYNTIFPYIRETDILKTHNLKLARARMMGNTRDGGSG